MEQKEGDKEERSLQLKELKEMSLLSLSHTPASDMDEILKIIKNFFGVYFQVKDEFTYSELIDIASSYGLDEHSLSQLVEYVNNLKQILYIKEQINDSDLAHIKSGITKLIGKLVPGTLAEPSKNKPKFQIIPHRFEKPVISPKPGLGASEPSLSKVQQPAKLLDLESEIVELEKQIASANNPFLKLELESLKGDVGLYKADPSAINPTTLSEKLTRIEGRI